MATLFAQNYKAQYIDKPSQKANKGETAGRKRLLFDKIVVPAVLANNDEILVGVIPANSMIVDAIVSINKSLGATGIVTLGHKATTDEAGNAIAEDTDGLAPAADGGGQAAFVRSNATSIALFKRLGSETLIFLKCTEVTDGTVTDGVISVAVEYVND
jgi:hypothetical protein